MTSPVRSSPSGPKVSFSTFYDIDSIPGVRVAGDGVTDDSQAIQTAIGYVADQGGGTLVFDAKVYALYSSLELFDNDRNVHLQGSSPTTSRAGDNGGTRFQWNNPDSQAAHVLMRKRGTRIENITFQTKTGLTQTSCVDVDNDPDGNVMTRGEFDNVLFISGDGRGTQTYGVRVGGLDASQFNLDFMQFSECWFQGQTQAGFYIHTSTGQSKAHNFRSCVFVQCLNAVETVSGSFIMYSSTYSGITGVPLKLGAVTDTIQHFGCDLEGCKQLMTVGNTSAAWAITFVGGRISLDSIVAGTPFIQYLAGGTLTLQGIDFGVAYNEDFQIQLGTPATAGNTILIGCLFPNATPILFANSYRVQTIACKYFIQGGSAESSMPNRVYQNATEKPYTIPSLVSFLSPNRAVALSGVADITEVFDQANEGQTDVVSSVGTRPTLVTAGSFKAFSFDGVSQHLMNEENNQAFEHPTVWAISFDAKPDDVGAGNRELMTKWGAVALNNRFLIRQTTTTFNLLVGGVTNLTCQIAGGFDASWHSWFILVDLRQATDAAAVKIFKDDVAQTVGFSGTRPAQSNFSTAPLVLGSFDGSSNFFPGQLSNLCFYQGGIPTAAQITAMASFEQPT